MFVKFMIVNYSQKLKYGIKLSINNVTSISFIINYYYHFLVFKVKMNEVCWSATHRLFFCSYWTIGPLKSYNYNFQNWHFLFASRSKFQAGFLAFQKHPYKFMETLEGVWRVTWMKLLLDGCSLSSVRAWVVSFCEKFEIKDDDDASTFRSRQLVSQCANEALSQQCVGANVGWARLSVTGVTWLKREVTCRNGWLREIIAFSSALTLPLSVARWQIFKHQIV